MENLGVIMNFRQLFLAIISMGLFAHSSVMPMGTALGYARTGFSKTCTGIHWGIFATPFLEGQYNFFVKNPLIASKKNLEKTKRSTENETLNKVFPELANEDRKEIKEIDKDIKKLIHEWDHNNALKNTELHISPSGRYQRFSAHTFYHYDELLAKQANIGVDPPFIHLLIEKRKAIQANNFNRVDEINAKLLKFKPLIQHELGHVKNNDFLGNYIATTIMPFITILGLKKAKKLIKPVQSQPTLFKDIMKIPSAIGKVLLTFGGLTLFYKHKEQLADNNIENNITNLENAKSFFEELQTPIEHRKNSPIVSLLLEEYEDPAHPSPTRRIWAIEKRIEKLKREQEKNK